MGTQQSCLCLLDHATAFDAVDHSIYSLDYLLGLEFMTLTSNGLSPTCHLVPSQSYALVVSLPHIGLPACAPHGSVFWPVLLFIMHTTASALALFHLIIFNHHLYADDTTLPLFFAHLTSIPV